MKRRKNGFFNFWFSFIPGAVEMYLGFFKMGISIMGTFVFIAFISSITGIGDIMLLDMVIYAVAFFHAHHIAGMTDKELNEIEDVSVFDYIIEGEKDKISKNKIRKIGAIVLIILGVCILIRALDCIIPRFYIISMFLNYMPRFALGVGCIIAGMNLIRGKKKTLLDEENENIWEEESDER